MDLESVTQSLLDAAVDPALWPAAMEAVGRYGNAAGAALIPVSGRLPSFLHSAAVKGAHDAYIADGWYLRDLRERGLPRMRTTGIFTDQDIASPEELQKAAFYRELLAPFDCNWGAGIGLKNGDDEWCLVVQRGDRQGHFEQHEQRNLLRLAAPLKQAALLSRQLSFANALGLNDAFDMVGCASMLISRFGKVIRINKSAEPYFDDGFALVDGNLSCAVAADASALRKMIYSLCIEAWSASPGVPRSQVVRRSSKPPFVVQAIRLTGIAGEIFSPARVLLFLVDPFLAREPVPLAELQKVFGLTKAEATLLSRLEAEIPLPMAAEQLGISYETARTHVKSILQKTGTKRQSEILALVRRMTPRLK